jgi:uncharacterized membrane protein
MPDDWLYPWLEWALVLTALGVAAVFKPWAVLRHRDLQNPWLAAIVILPWAWWTRHLLPSGMALHVSGACLLVLMFGWPLATWSLALVGILAGLLEAYTPAKANPYQHLPQAQTIHNLGELGHWFVRHADDIASQIAWMGVLPATLALGLGLLVRRLLPHHLFVFIMGRGFFATALAVTGAGLISTLCERVPPSIDAGEWMLAHWLLGWGEAFSTGMLVAIFVAFKPHWLLTYSDERYLPPRKPSS